MSQQTQSNSPYPSPFSSSQFIWTPSRQTYLQQLITFIEDGSKTVLFIFGPSGCGKTQLIRRSLRHSEIPFKQVHQNHPNEQAQNQKQMDIIDLVVKHLSSNRTINMVYLFYDFPLASYQLQKYTSFKYCMLPNLLQKPFNHNKHIFILNSELYNSYYILGEGNANRLDSYSCVQVLKMQAYGKRQMKEIVRKVSMLSERDIDQIVETAQGDARKAAQLVYLKNISPIIEKEKEKIKKQRKQRKQIKQLKIKRQKQNNSQNCSQNSRSLEFSNSKTKNEIIDLTQGSSAASIKSFSMLKLNPLSNQKSISISKQAAELKQQNQTKLTMFHWIGRFLYGKRFNIDFDPNKKVGPKNQFSRYYTQQEINYYNPRFYFSPLQGFYNSKLPQCTFISILHQNFLLRFGNIKDVTQMLDVFRFVDETFKGSVRFNDLQVVEEMEVEIIGWGMLICNKNSVRDGKMFKIGGGRCKTISRLKMQKLQIIKSYFIKNADNFHRVADIIQFAHMIGKSPKLTQKQDNTALLSVIFSNHSRVQSNEIPSDQLQDQINIAQNCQKLQSVADEIIKQRRKKQQLMKMILQDSDGEDIDMQDENID